MFKGARGWLKCISTYQPGVRLGLDPACRCNAFGDSSVCLMMTMISTEVVTCRAGWGQTGAGSFNAAATGQCVPSLFISRPNAHRSPNRMKYPYGLVGAFTSLGAWGWRGHRPPPAHDVYWCTLWSTLLHISAEDRTISCRRACAVAEAAAEASVKTQRESAG